MRIDRLPFKVNYFWSYKKDADLPPGIIAEKVLIYGDFEDIYAFQHEVGSEFNKKYACTYPGHIRGSGELPRF